MQVQSTNNINVYDMSVYTSLALSCLIQDQVLTKDSAECALGMDKCKNASFTGMHCTHCSLQAAE